MASLFSNTKHTGTIGGSRAANRLDEILCEINNVKLLSRISRLLSVQQREYHAINTGIKHPKYRIVLLKKYRDDCLKDFERIDFKGFDLLDSKRDLITSLTRNAIITNYRIALRAHSNADEN